MDTNVGFIKTTAIDYDLDYDAVFNVWYKHIGGNQMKHDYNSFYNELEEINKLKNI